MPKWDHQNFNSRIKYAMGKQIEFKGKTERILIKIQSRVGKEKRKKKSWLHKLLGTGVGSAVIDYYQNSLDFLVASF